MPSSLSDENEKDVVEDANNDDEHVEPSPHSHQEYDAASVEAGVVRGVSRSVAQRSAAVASQRAGRAMAKLPSVGKLPRTAVPRNVVPPTAASRVRLPKTGATPRPVRVSVPKPRAASVPKPRTPGIPKRGANVPKPMPRRVPVKQVAQVTDRMSTGLDIWESASSSSLPPSEEPSNNNSDKNKTSANQQSTTANMEDSHNKWRQRLSRTETFAISLVKNTILGAIVFETYCSIVAQAAEHATTSSSWPASSWLPVLSSETQPDVVEEADNYRHKLENATATNAFVNTTVVDDDEINVGSPLHDTILPEESDEEDGQDEHSPHPPTPLDVFEQTPVVVHFVAGAIAGALQGLGGRAWEIAADLGASARTQLRLLRNNKHTAANTARATLPRPASGWNVLANSNMGQHAVAHSLLFGSYEGLKRGLLSSLGHSRRLPENYSLVFQYRPPPTMAFSSSSSQEEQDEQQLQLQQRVEYLAAVGLAGGMAGQLQHVASHVLESRQSQLLQSPQLRWWLSALPSLRSTMWAFPGSAIAFLAFEYGKDHVADLQ